MKLNIKTLCSSFLVSTAFFTMSGCSEMLETDSGRIAFEKDNQLKNTNELFYTISGILSEVQKVGDRYVLFGELRGDLMTVSENASVSLKEINGFQTTSDNAYADKHDYYTIINNCNYALRKIDTSTVVQNEKVMLPAYVVIKSIRAWTYLQLAQIFGEVVYMEEPVLNLESSLAEYPILNTDELVETLITDLRSYTDVPLPASGISPDNFVPVQILLGDLYLYQNNYEQAAQVYHDFITAHSYILSQDYVSRWMTSTYEDAATRHRDSYLNEAISSIRFNTDSRQFHSNLVSLTYNGNPSLVPVQNYMDSMAATIHFHSDKIGNAISGYSEGDLRGNVTVYKTKMQYGDAYSLEKIGENNSATSLIYKFFHIGNESTSGSDPKNNLIKGKLVYLTQIPIFRIPQLYLRYAEAVNRTGKPSLAFAVLKYGLTNSNIKNPLMVNPSEIANKESYLNFENTVFDQNIPTAARGRGLGVSKDVNIFVIPDYTRYVTVEGVKTPSQNSADLAAAHQDSINWVESRILDELAAETPFEGNRFFDLLRVSRRRENHPAFMAEKVSAKFSNPEAMKVMLMNMNAWYIK